MVSRSELERQLEQFRQQLSAEVEVRSAMQAAHDAHAAALSAQADQARAEAARERRLRYAALQALSASQEHVGLLYGRLRRVDELVAGAAELPAEFVAAVREQTQPDFAALLGR